MENELFESTLKAPFVVSDVIWKLVTSTSALIAEEPAELEDLISNASAVPKLYRTQPDQAGCLYSGTNVLDQYCFGFVVSYPSKVEPNFGKLSVSSQTRRRFEVKEGVLEAARLIAGLKELRVNEVDDNVCDAILLGSTIYSWVEKINSLKGVDRFIPGGQDIYLKRETRTQLPPGVYTIAFFNILVDAEKSAQVDAKLCRVFLKIEAEKGSSSKNKRNQSKKTDDVIAELER